MKDSINICVCDVCGKETRDTELRSSDFFCHHCDSWSSKKLCAERSCARLDDDPFYDGTDFAHAAWWRGNDAGVLSTVKALNEILDRAEGSEGNPGTFGLKELQDLKNRLIVLVDSARK